MPLILICGYRHSGKDSFFQSLLGENNYSWKVYVKPNNQNLNQNLDQVIRSNSKYIRIGFADILKREVIDDLKLSNGKYEKSILPEEYDFEKINLEKDVPLKSLIKCESSNELPNELPKELYDQIILNNMTFRDFCIKKGIEKRRIDINYWCKLVTPTYLNNLNHNVVITDFRFPNEYQYFKELSEQRNEDISPPITIRVFRKEVLIPDCESERELNLFPTDYLIVPSENYKEQFETAKQRFQFYTDFIISDFIISDFIISDSIISDSK